MDENRIITASFGEGEHNVTVSPVYQYNYGNIIRFEGIALPYAFEVHFANDQYGDSTTSIGSNNEVEIPDTYLTHDGELYAWVFLHDDLDDGETKYQVIIPIIGRARITNGTPTPVQQDAITQAIAALDSAVADCEGCVSNYPQINDSHWWVYDPETDEMVDSGIVAEGTNGTDGADGRDGRDGTDGVTPIFSIGTVSTGDPGSSASVEQTGTTEAPVLNFTIPRGDTGSAGDPSSLIDDTTPSSSKTYSSEKIESMLIADISNTAFPTT